MKVSSRATNESERALSTWDNPPTNKKGVIIINELFVMTAKRIQIITILTKRKGNKRKHIFGNAGLL